MKLTINMGLYNMKKEKAFIEMYNLRFPECVDIAEDYQYDISPMILSDYNYCVFAVSDGNKIRIMAAKLDYSISGSKHNLNDIEISEAIITDNELREIISGLDTILI